MTVLETTRYGFIGLDDEQTTLTVAVRHYFCHTVTLSEFLSGELKETIVTNFGDVVWLRVCEYIRRNVTLTRIDWAREGF